MDAYDVVVIGAGPAGLTAGIYSGRARLKTLVLEGMMPGGQVVVTSHIENYPGVGSTTGTELIASMTEQMSSFGAELKTAQASSIEASGEGFVVAAGSKTFETRTIIAASGTAYKKLGVPGEAEFARSRRVLLRDLRRSVLQGPRDRRGRRGRQRAPGGSLSDDLREEGLPHPPARRVPGGAHTSRSACGDNEKIECFCSNVVERHKGRERRRGHRTQGRQDGRGIRRVLRSRACSSSSGSCRRRSSWGTLSNWRMTDSC